jgi:metal-responsive CopG/Arc/MetJ family transcriptional regulator
MRRVYLNIPDTLFFEAERVAAKLGVTPSQFYADAMRQFVAHEQTKQRAARQMQGERRRRRK